MMAKDPDVAFVCGMIAHHTAAINMSEVELKYGDDQQAKSMAEKIIAAQKKEIEEMTRVGQGTREVSPSVSRKEVCHASSSIAGNESLHRRVPVLEPGIGRRAYRTEALQVDLGLR